MADSGSATVFVTKTVPCSAIDQGMGLIRVGTSDMKSRVLELLTQRWVIGGAAAVLLVTFGLVAVWAWAPSSIDIADPALAAENFPEQSDVNELVRRRCGECGVVESTRMIDQSDENPGDKTGRYELTPKAKVSEVTVRMSNGESHLFTDANRLNWRPGERVIIIEGAKP